MREHIKRRTDFSGIEANTSFIPYKPYLEIPNYDDYKKGETRTIILVNQNSGKPELIEYELVGATDFNEKKGCCYWGKINASGASAELVFDFWPNGKLRQISVVFCGKGKSNKLKA